MKTLVIKISLLLAIAALMATVITAILNNPYRTYTFVGDYHWIGSQTQPDQSLKIYLDDHLIYSTIISNPIHYGSTPTFYIGTNMDGRAAGSSGIRGFPGVIDEIRISKIARTAAEVETLTPPAAPSMTVYGGMMLGCCLLAAAAIMLKSRRRFPL